MAKETKPGLYYTQFDDETWEEALDAHAIGFDNLADAIEETYTYEESTHFVVKDSNGKVVFDGYTKGKK